MYYLSPFTYLINAVLSVGLSHTQVHCADIELLSFQPTNGTTCGYISTRGEYLVDGQATGECQYCPIGETDVYLEFLKIRYGGRWRNLGLLWAYTVFNALAAVGVHWLARVPKGSKKAGRVETVEGKGKGE